VVKPDISWRVVPDLIRRRLKPDGVAVFNLMSPPGGRWREGVAGITRFFPAARIIHLDDFENRILITGGKLPPTNVLGKELRHALRRLRSRQTARIQVRSLR
jgi:hypothetical protein